MLLDLLRLSRAVGEASSGKLSGKLSIVTVALSVTIRPQFAIECLRRSNQQQVVTLGPNLGVFPLKQTRHVRVAKSENPRLTNGKW